MADTYNPVQTVAPQTGSPDNLISTRASPEAFGSQVGQSEQKLGAVGEEASNQQMAVVMQYQQMDNENTANKAAMTYADFVMKQEMALKQNQGQNAAAALPGFEKGMQDQMAASAAQIKSPLARNSFLTDARNFYNRTMYSAGSYVGDEMRKSVTQSWVDKTNALINFATAHVDDPGAVDQTISQVVDSSLAEAQHRGILDPNSAHAIVQKNVGDLVSSAIIAKLGQGGNDLNARARSLKEAQEMYQKYQKLEIPDSPGIPILDDLHSNHLQASLNSAEFTLSSRADTETAHNISEQTVNQTKIDYQKYINDNPQLKGSEDGYIGYTDWLEQNLNKYHEDARTSGKDQTGRSIIADEAASLTEIRLRTMITNQNTADKGNAETIQRFLTEGDNGRLPTSERDLTGGPPQVAQAWKDIIDRRPTLAKAVRKMFGANAGGKQLTYGTDFYNNLEGILSGRTTKAEDIWKVAGPTKNAPLTNTGADILYKEMNFLNDPKNAGFAEAEKSFITNMRKKVTNSATGPGFHDAEGDKKFSNWLLSAMPKIQLYRNAGKSVHDLFDEDGDSYVGSDINLAARTPAQLKTDMLRGIINPGAFNIGAPEKKAFDFKALDGIQTSKEGIVELHKAIDSHQMTPKEAIEYATKRKWGTSSGAPEVSGAR